MDRDAHQRQTQADFTKLIDAAERFHRWWNDGEARLKSRHDSAHTDEKRAA